MQQASLTSVPMLWFGRAFKGGGAGAWDGLTRIQPADTSPGAIRGFCFYKSGPSDAAGGGTVGASGSPLPGTGAGRGGIGTPRRLFTSSAI